MQEWSSVCQEQYDAVVKLGNAETTPSKIGTSGAGSVRKSSLGTRRTPQLKQQKNDIADKKKDKKKDKKEKKDKERGASRL